MDTMYVTRQIDTPLGPLALLASDTALVSIDYGSVEADRYEAPASHPILDCAEGALADYFAHRSVREVPLDWSGVGEFGRAVLAATAAIEPGTTRTYGEVAALAGSPRAARAAGGALKRNPFPVLVPCHRVRPASGALGGYAGTSAAGQTRKQWLLDFEAQKKPVR